MKRPRTSTTSITHPLVVAFISTAILSCCIWGLQANNAPIAIQLAWVNLWSLVFACTRATALSQIAASSPHLFALLGLPAPIPLIVAWHAHRYVRASLTHLPELIVAMVLIASDHWSSTNLILACLAGVMTWTVSVGLGTLLGTFAPWATSCYRLAPTAAFITAFILAQHVTKESLQLPHLLSAAIWLNGILPTGWPGLALDNWLRGSPGWQTLATICPALLLIALAWQTRRRLLPGLATVWGPFPSDPSASSASSDPSDPSEKSPEAPSNSGCPESVSESAATHPNEPVRTQPDASPGPGQAAWGWIENHFWRRLTDRQHVLWELLHTTPPGWTRQVHQTLRILAIVLLVRTLLARLWPTADLTFWWCDVMVYALLFLGPVTGVTQFQRAFQLIGIGRQRVPLYAVFPVGFRELSSLFLRARWTCILANAPGLILFATAVAWLHRLSPLQGLAWGLKGLWVALVAQPLLLVLRFSAGTNDTRRSTFRIAFLVIAAFVLALLTLILGVLALVVEPPFNLLCGAALFLPPWLFLLLYRRLYNRGAFDLIGTLTEVE